MYHLSNQVDTPITPGKAALLVALCAVWLLTGLIGHDPWKPEEAHSFGIVYHMLQSGDWLVPTLAGEPYLEKPPLFYISAALLAKLLSPLLPLHDGARLVSGLYMGLALLFIALAGRELYGKERGWGTAIILVGCLGLLVRAHILLTDLALLTGSALMLYALALHGRRPLLAGVLLGSGVGIGFMSKGFIALGFWFFIGLALFTLPNWRRREYFLTQALAVLTLLPWVLIWPLLLYLHAPLLFHEWFWTLNLARFLEHAQSGHLTQISNYLKQLPWMAWPASPLAAWTLWHARKKLLSEEGYQLPLIALLVMLLTLSLVPAVQDTFALPMLLPLALLATPALATLRRGAASALDWFGIMTFALIGLIMWAGWVGLLVDNQAKITRLLKDFQPVYEAQFQPLPFWIALIASILWVMLVWRIGRSIRRSVVNWAGGMTLVWVLAMTLWLPWLENNKSYRSMVMEIRQALPEDYNCVSGRGVEIGPRAMLHYFGDIIVSSQPNPACDYLLVQGGPSIVPFFRPEEKWRKIWEGGRPGDKIERYYLYRRG